MEKNYKKELVEKILNGEINFVEYDAKLYLEKKGFVRTEFLLRVVDIEGTLIPVVDVKLVSGTDARIYQETLWPLKNATPENLELLELGAIDTFDIHVGFAVEEKDGRKIIHESTPKVSSVVCSGNKIRFSGENRVAPHGDKMNMHLSNHKFGTSTNSISQYYDLLCKSADDIKQNIVKDEYGVAYSEDGTWLISAPADLYGSYTIKEGTVSICNRAFEYLEHLENIVFPLSLQCIGEYSFYGCKKLSTVILPKNLIVIGKSAFSGYSNSPQRNVNSTYSSSIQYIGDTAFEGNNLRYFIIPETVEHIGVNPFKNCENVCLISNSDRYIVIEQGLVDIKCGKLISCPLNITNLICDETIEIIGDSAVSMNKSIISVKTTSNLRIIEEFAFFRCPNLEQVSLTDGLQTIESSAFASCKKLSRIEIPDSVTDLGSAMFHGDEGINYFSLGKQIKHIDCQTFCGCDGIKNFSTGSNPYFVFEDGCLYSNDFCTLVKCLVPNSTDKFTVKYGVREILPHAFCSYSFKEIVLPSTLRKIGKSAFYGSSFEEIIIPEHVEELNLCAFIQSKHLYKITFLSKKTCIDIGEEVHDTWYVLPDLKKIIVPSESIGHYNQQFQSFLQKRSYVQLIQNDIKIDWSDGPMYDEKNRSIISYGSLQTEFAIKEGIKTICDYCFFDSYDENEGLWLQKITIPRSVSHIGRHVFNSCIESIICHSPHFVVEAGALLSADKKRLIRYFGDDDEYTVPPSVEILEDGSFEYCRAKHVSIGNSVKTMVGNPFMALRGNPTTIEIASSRFNIEDEAIYDKTTKTLVAYLGDSKCWSIKFGTISIAANAFFSSALETIYIPDSVKYIEDTSFMLCVNLTSVFVNDKESKDRLISNNAYFINNDTVKIKKRTSSFELTEKIRNYLITNGVEHFYHFTDRRNLESIISHGGLFSWKYCLDHNISIPNAGGSEESRSLDLKYGLEDYVRLSFCDDHPMAWRLKQQGADLVLLKIKIDVAWRLQDTMFSDINATDSSHHHGNKLSDLQRVDLNATKQHFVSSSDSAFKKHQAEILVKTFIPLEYIENINNPITLFDGNDDRFKNNGTGKYNDSLLDELPF